MAAPEIQTHPLAKCCWCGSAFVLGAITVAGLVPWVCPTEVCWRRQVAHAMFVQLKGKPRKCRFVPVPRQVEAEDLLRSEDGPTYLLIGGAAGGSKSRGVREIGHSYCMTVPGFRVLLLRRTYKELDQTHLRDIEMEAPEMGAHAVPSAKICRYPNGSMMQFGHCETAADAANYLSAEYDLIIFDELVTFEETPFLLISSRARSSKPGIRPKILCGTNPGGPQSHWVRARFIDKTVDLDMFPDYDPKEWAFIPSKLEDNPYLDRNYERKLLALPPEMRKAYRDGDWDIFPGQYFPEWRRAVHVSAAHRVYDPGFTRVLSMDWGYVKPGVVAWWVLVDGHAYREDEYVFKHTLAVDVGKEVARRTVARGLTRVPYLVYDTAMNAPNGDTGESTIDSVRRGLRAGGLSIATRTADKERLNGWQRLRHWLGMAPDQRPWLESSPLCTYFNRTLPSLVSDTNKPEDVDCWAVGTLVSTPHGPRPIEMIVPGDLVDTPIGPRPVLRAYFSGVSRLCEVALSDGRILQGTQHHPVYVRGKGLVSLSDVERHDILIEKSILWSKWLNIAVSCIDVIRGVSTTLQAVRQSVKAQRAFTDRCGWILDATYHRVATSITSMATMITTNCQTSPVSKNTNTLAFMPEYVWPVNLENGSRRGVARSLDERYSKTMHGRCALERRYGHWRASIVRSLLRRDRLASFFALTDVRSWGTTLFVKCARCVGWSSKASAARRDKWSPVRIVAVGRSEKRERVYNLTVADAHLFYANGILSSNTDGEDHAADEARYFVMSRPTPGVQESATPTKEMSLGWLKARTQTPAGSLTRSMRLG